MKDSKKTKEPSVLADHKRVGKRFIPPMAQLGMSDVRWVESLAPEFLWIALLHDVLGFKRGAEIARVVADACKATDPSLGWCASMSSFSTLSEEMRPHFNAALADNGVADEMARALGALHAHYPAHPLSFALPADATGELSTLKRVVGLLIGSRADVHAMRTQATAVYLALTGGWLHVQAESVLADFSDVERYPDTEKSQLVASAVRAALNGLTIQMPTSDWPRYFWNRGLELEPCTLA
ncbi:MAG TPA: hypothetical protein VGM90_18505 [Kofleriaceae bacterium]|jgi:hypothetical protein